MKRTLLVLTSLAALAAEDVTVPAYVVPNSLTLTPAERTALEATDAAILRKIRYGTITYLTGLTTEQAAQVRDGIASYPILRVVATPVLQGQVVYRAESLSGTLGTHTSTLKTWTAQDNVQVTLQPPATPLKLYRIDGAMVHWFGVPDGHPVLPGNDPCGWTWRFPRLMGAADAIGVDKVGLGTVASHELAAPESTQPLAGWGGAYLQLRNLETGQIVYVRQNNLTHTGATAAAVDPIAVDGQLIRGTYTLINGGVTVKASYDIAATNFVGEVSIAACGTISLLPPELQASATLGETPLPPAGGPVVVDELVMLGEVSDRTASGTVAPTKLQFYATGSQSTERLFTDVSTAQNDTTDQPTATGTTVLAEATALQPGVMTYSRNADGTFAVDGATVINPSAALLAGEQEQIDRFTLHFNAQGQPIEPQPQPHPTAVTMPQGMAQTAGQLDELLRLSDMVNDQIKEQLPGQHGWVAPSRSVHHGAMIYPIDIYSGDLITKYSSFTGKTKSDLDGPSSPGDGDNPTVPLPNGVEVEAGYPFYDFDDDGDLDRFYTTDPFDGGYKYLRLIWWNEPWVKQLSAFYLQPPTQVMVSAMTKPMLDQQTGQWAVREDLMLYYGHNFKPFSHKIMKWNEGLKTYYTAGHRTLLDQIDAQGRFQFALRNFNVVNQVVTGQTEGLPAEDLVYEVDTKTETIPYDVDGNSTIDANEKATRITTVRWYTKLTYIYQGATGLVWDWSNPGFVLPGDIPDRPGIPAMASQRLERLDGVVINTNVAARPGLQDAQAANTEWFDANTIPVASVDTQYVANPMAFMYDYPLSAATVLGGTGTPNPGGRAYPWNVYYKNSPQGSRHCEMAFGINENSQIRLDLFPAYLSAQQPKITYDGLLNQSGTYVGIKWIVRENTKLAPSGDQPLKPQWRDGRCMYLEPGWTPGQPAYLPGKAMYHPVAWNQECDVALPITGGGENGGVGFSNMSSAGIAGAALLPLPFAAPIAVADMMDQGEDGVGAGIFGANGDRIYEIDSGLAEYVFRGAKYSCLNVEEQRRMLRRMWHYYFFGEESIQVPTSTCLPSVVVPQRWFNGRLDSRPLNEAKPPPRSTAPITGDGINNQDLAGNVGGFLTDGMATPTSYTRVDEDLVNDKVPIRDIVKRREMLMKEQVFIFSASRGREWELEMARRMPTSVRLLCVEWDNKDYVQAVCKGSRVEFIDAVDAAINGVKRNSSSEQKVLMELAKTWFDGRVTVMAYKKGRIAAENEIAKPGFEALKAILADPDTDKEGGLAQNKADIDGGKDGEDNVFQAHTQGKDRPAGIVRFGFTLRSSPEHPIRQWAPDGGQQAEAEKIIEFRHPMLLVYHDRSSSTYVHYGRNCDPEEVFGAGWDLCAPPPYGINAAAPEFQRRLRFEAWQTVERLKEIYDHLHPQEAGKKAALASLVGSLPPAPPQPPAQDPLAYFDATHSQVPPGVEPAPVDPPVGVRPDPGTNPGDPGPSPIPALPAVGPRPDPGTNPGDPGAAPIIVEAPVGARPDPGANPGDPGSAPASVPPPSGPRPDPGVNPGDPGAAPVVVNPPVGPRPDPGSNPGDPGAPPAVVAAPVGPRPDPGTNPGDPGPAPAVVAPPAGGRPDPGANPGDPGAAPAVVAPPAGLRPDPGTNPGDPGPAPVVVAPPAGARPNPGANPGDPGPAPAYVNPPTGPRPDPGSNPGDPGPAPTVVAAPVGPRPDPGANPGDPGAAPAVVSPPVGGRPVVGPNPGDPGAPPAPVAPPAGARPDPGSDPGDPGAAPAVVAAPIGVRPAVVTVDPGVPGPEPVIPPPPIGARPTPLADPGAPGAEPPNVANPGPQVGSTINPGPAPEYVDVPVAVADPGPDYWTYSATATCLGFHYLWNGFGYAWYPIGWSVGTPGGVPTAATKSKVTIGYPTGTDMGDTNQDATDTAGASQAAGIGTAMAIFPLSERRDSSPHAWYNGPFAYLSRAISVAATQNDTNWNAKKAAYDAYLVQVAKRQAWENWNNANTAYQAYLTWLAAKNAYDLHVAWQTQYNAHQAAVAQQLLIDQWDNQQAAHDAGVAAHLTWLTNKTQHEQYLAELAAQQAWDSQNLAYTNYLAAKAAWDAQYAAHQNYLTVLAQQQAWDAQNASYQTYLVAQATWDAANAAYQNYLTLVAQQQAWDAQNLAYQTYLANKATWDAATAAYQNYLTVLAQQQAWDFQNANYQAYLVAKANWDAASAAYATYQTVLAQQQAWDAQQTAHQNYLNALATWTTANTAYQTYLTVLAQQQAWDAENALYQAYLTARSNWEAASTAYQTYLTVLAQQQAWDAENASYLAYLTARSNWELATATYQTYLTVLASQQAWDAQNATYQTYLANKAAWDVANVAYLTYQTVLGQQQTWDTQNANYQSYVTAKNAWDVANADYITYQTVLAQQVVWDGIQANHQAYLAAKSAWDAASAAYTTYQTVLAQQVSWDAQDLAFTTYQSALAAWITADAAYQNYQTVLAQQQDWDTKNAAYQAYVVAQANWASATAAFQTYMMILGQQQQWDTTDAAYQQYLVDQANWDTAQVAYSTYLSILADQQAWDTQNGAYSQYVDDYTAWNGRVAAYATYQVERTQAEVAHADWLAKVAAWNAWSQQNAQLVNLQAEVGIYESTQAAWVNVTQSAIDQPGVGWAGDESVMATTLAQIQGIQPRLPVWEAYLWTITPSNQVFEVLNP